MLLKRPKSVSDVSLKEAVASGLAVLLFELNIRSPKENSLNLVKFSGTDCLGPRLRPSIVSAGGFFM